MWISLQNVIHNIRVTNILLSIKDDFTYNEDNRSVYVSSLDKINQFLQKRKDALSENEVEKIVMNPSGFVTN